MPIRTNRGRAAVYRRLWGWPLRSPRHLVISIVGVAVLVALISVAAAQLKIAPSNSAAPGATSSAQPPGGPTSDSAASTTTGEQTRLTSPPETPSSAPAPAAALNVITVWGQAWVRHPVGITSQQWLDQLKPYTDAEFLATTMSSVDPANIVATQVTGPPQVVNSYTDRVEATLPTNGGTLDVTVVQTPQGWLVNAYNGGT